MNPSTPLRELALLDNVTWHALSGPQAAVSSGDQRGRRYAKGFSPIVAFPDPSRPDFAALARWVDVDEPCYTADWRGEPPPGWAIDADATMALMVWTGARPDAGIAPDAVPLTGAHADAALALAQLTRPGPFGPRTIELGDYLGVFDADGRLLAMAGERMHAGPWREISGVCTRPEQQGRGLARRLMLSLIRRQLERGEQPFLHVMTHNTGALGLYAKMGFAVHRECAVRVIRRTA